MAARPSLPALIADLRLQLTQSQNATRDMHQRWLTAKVNIERLNGAYQQEHIKWHEQHELAETLRAENEAFRRRNEQHCKAYNEVATELEAAEATAARLREALEKFGNHDNGCDHWDGGQCDCGWAALEGAKSHD